MGRVSMRNHDLQGMAFVKYNYPQELIDMIVDNVADGNDVQCLRACSLAATAFQQRAQMYLFRTLKFYDLNFWTPASWVSKLENLSLALTIHPHLARYTRGLRQC